MSTPWLSVVMPTYNGAPYVAFALEGIRAQRADDLEVIVVDDGSRDATLDVVRSYRGVLAIEVIERPRVGNWVENTNHGFSLARGEYACILHQDDVWSESRLATLRALAAQHPTAVLCLHASRFIDPRGQRLGSWRCPLPPGPLLAAELVVSRLLVQNFIAMPAPLFRREAFERVGGMDSEMWHTADWDLWLKLAGAGGTVYTAKTLAGFRIHPESQSMRRSRDLAAFRAQYESVLARHLGRWEGTWVTRPAVRRAAQFSIDLNVALAAHLHGARVDLPRLARGLLTLGPEAALLYLRDSRVFERVGARLALRVTMKGDNG